MRITFACRLVFAATQNAQETNRRGRVLRNDSPARFLRPVNRDDVSACAAYLEKARWGDGFACPHCGTAGEPFHFENRPGVLRCRKCRQNTGLTVGTVMERSHTPLNVARSAPAAHRPGAFPGPEGDLHGTPPARQGGGPAGQGERPFWAAYLVASQTPGMSAVQFQRAGDRGARRSRRFGQRPSAQDHAEVGDPESGAGGSACQASRDQEGTRGRACRASSGQEDVVEVAVRCRRRSPQGSAKVAAPEGYDQVAVPGERPPAQGREDVAEPDRDAGSPA